MSSKLAPSHLPTAGASIVRIPTLSGTVLGGGATSAVFKYRWPANWFLPSLLLLPRSGLKSDAAGLVLRIQDDDGRDLVSDGLQLAALAPFVPSLALAGVTPFGMLPWAWAPRWFSLERIVRAGEQWIFQLSNTTGGNITPELLFQVETPERL